MSSDETNLRYCMKVSFYEILLCAEYCKAISNENASVTIEGPEKLYV